MSTTIVTGAAGFIGSHLVDLLLEQGHTVRAIDVSGQPHRIAQHVSKPEFEYHQLDVKFLDLTDPIWVNVDWIFHLAGRADIVPSIEKPHDYMNTNIMGTVKVLEAARRAKVKKVVYAASASCYGDTQDVRLPTREVYGCQPEYPYALSKYLGEQAVMHWGKVYGLSVNSLRLFNVYGLRARTTGAYGAVMGVFLRQKLAGAPLTIVGDGTQRRDFVHVRDVARAFLLAAENPRSGRIWNVGTGRPQSIGRLAELIGGPGYPTVALPWRPGEPYVTQADIGRIQDELGWDSKVGFEDGIAEMMANIDDWRDAPLWTIDSITQATEAWHANLGKG